ncbi:MFS-type transporter SLC18B1 [Holothuria leucospilota]|uniref:MFS-type transporter SLC18B1 n=1 Tax=Holothuria leucospilota TaxID=206669 RepID=A0A9Q1BAB5_HOLLE|nr:MFS-type transporter SLC18B1 [Holothuria leucospilota]
MTITANTFPDNMAQMMGILEAFSGVGFMAGPPLGGLLYSIGGYKLPFLVLGGISLATILVNVFLLPSVGVEQTQTGSIKNMLLIPAFYPVAIGVVVGSACLGFLDPTLSLHLSSFNLSPSLVAVAFLLIGGMYAVTSPIWGYIADKKKCTKIMMVLGYYVSTICYLLLGPSPILKLPNDLWIVILALGLTGLSLGSALMPAFLDLFLSASWYGFPDDLSTQGVVSGLFNSLFSLGGFLGPLLGGYLVQRFDFPWASTIFAAANLFVVLLICLFSLWEYRCGKGRRLPWIKFNEGSSSEEQEPLLANNASGSSSPEKSINV